MGAKFCRWKRAQKISLSHVVVPWLEIFFFKLPVISARHAWVALGARGTHPFVCTICSKVIDHSFPLPYCSVTHGHHHVIVHISSDQESVSLFETF